jgi:WXG100 family type VII secretion target
MADLIKVNTNRLKTDTSSIKGHISSIEKEIADLRRHNIALDAMWDGPSSETFKAAFEADIKSLEQMIASLKSLNEYEDNARDKYDDCERKVADLVNQIKVK